MVDRADFLIKEQFDQPWVSETASFVQRIVIVLISILLHLVGHTLVRWVLKIFDQDQFHDFLLIIFDSEHEWRLPFLLLCQEGRYTKVVQNVVDDKNVPAHARPEQIAILDQRLLIALQVFFGDDFEVVDALGDDGSLLWRHDILLILINTGVRLDSRLSFPSKFE